MKSGNIYKRMNLTIFTLVMVFLYIPIIILIIFSFNDSKIVAGWQGFTVKYYLQLFDNQQIKQAFQNTMLIAILSTPVFYNIGGFGSSRTGKQEIHRQKSDECPDLCTAHYAGYPDGCITGSDVQFPEGGNGDGHCLDSPHHFLRILHDNCCSKQIAGI
jgi:hypothetical protein